MKRLIAAIAFMFVMTNVAFAQQSTIPTIKSRSFVFTYAGAITDLPVNKIAKVWLPLAVTTAEQDVVIKEVKPPRKHGITKDKVYGNGIIFFETQANDKGEIPFHLEYKVVRREVKTGLKGSFARMPAESNDLMARYLRPDARVPTTGRPLDLIKDKSLPSDPFESAKVLYDVVNGHMKYSKEGTGWGQGVFTALSSPQRLVETSALRSLQRPLGPPQHKIHSTCRSQP